MTQMKPSKSKRKEDKIYKINQIKEMIHSLFPEYTNFDEAAIKFSPLLYVYAKLKFNLVKVPKTWNTKIFKFHSNHISIESNINIKTNKKIKHVTDVDEIYLGNKSFFTNQLRRNEVTQNIYKHLSENILNLIENTKEGCEFVSRALKRYDIK